MKKLSILSVLALSAVQVFAQMGARIDQFYLDRSSVIPAAITATDKGYVSLYYNKLFIDVPGSPQHTLFNAAMPLPKQNTAFGLFYMKENIAFSEMHNAYATYAYRIPLGNDVNLSLGVSAGVLAQNFDASKAVFYDDNDPKIIALLYSPPVVRADLRASFYVSSEKFYAGMVVSRLPKPRFDYSYYNYSASYDLQTQASWMLGYNAAIDDNFTLKPSFNFNMYNWDYLYYQGNLTADFQGKFWLGFGVNNLWQAGFNVGLKPQEDITCAYSYTVPDGVQRGLLGPMHEFTTTIGFGALGAGIAGNGNGNGNGSTAGSEGAGSNGGSSGDDENGGKRRRGGDLNGQGVSPSERIRKDVIVKSFSDMESFGKGNDTSGITLPPIPKVKPEPGHYLVAGLHASEEKANKMIKDLYMKDVLAFKFYDPRNKSYYVYIKRYDTEKDANKGTFYFEVSVPNIWVREMQ